MRLLRVIVIFLFIYASIGILCAQDGLPCQTEVHDTNSEVRELGTGSAEAAFDALTEAVKDAMQKVRPKFMKLYPEIGFEYSLTIDKSSENIELDTSIGQPAIICNEIVKTDREFTAYVVISFDVNKTDEKQN